MRRMVSLFWDICLLKKAPQDVPHSHVLLVIVVAVGFMVDNLNLGFAAPKIGFPTVIWVVLLHISIFLGSLAVLLTLMGYAPRIVQTLTSLVGSGVIISLIAMPVLIISSMTEKIEVAMGFSIVLFMLNIWSLVVTTHIFRHALSINIILAGLLALGYLAMSIKLIDMFIPVSS